MTSFKYKAVITGLAVLFLSGSALFAQDMGDHRHEEPAPLASPYVGEETRAIPTLSESDIRELENGEGWGLAKAAELNGLPGPAHLLEMVGQGAIHLTEEQLSRVRDLYDAMKAKAIPVGRRLIELERELNRRFADGELSPAELERLLTRIGETNAELRYIHLSTHLETFPVLSSRQIETYNRLRGYSTPGQKK